MGIPRTLGYLDAFGPELIQTSSEKTCVATPLCGSIMRPDQPSFRFGDEQAPWRESSPRGLGSPGLCVAFRGLYAFHVCEEFDDGDTKLISNTTQAP